MKVILARASSASITLFLLVGARFATVNHAQASLPEIPRAQAFPWEASRARLRPSDAPRKGRATQETSGASSTEAWGQKNQASPFSCPHASVEPSVTWTAAACCRFREASLLAVESSKTMFRQGALALVSAEGLSMAGGL